MTPTTEPVRAEVWVGPAGTPPPTSVPADDWTALEVAAFEQIAAASAVAVDELAATFRAVAKAAFAFTLDELYPLAFALLHGTGRRARRRHPRELPHRSRMHAAYRAKTRRRNRR